MAQNNHQNKEIYEPIKNQIKKNENIKVQKKAKIKGAQLKLQGKFKEEIPIMMQGNITYRCYLAALEKNKEPIQFRLRTGSGENSEYLLSLSSDENGKEFIYKDIQIKQTGKYWLESDYKGKKKGLGILVLALVKSN